MAQLGGIPILILKEGTEQSKGNTAREKNIIAIQAVADAVKSTLGPRGMDKMMVDSLGDITISNDGATILDNLEIQNPGAKMAVAIARSQDQNIGDGTTSSVIIAGHLLTVANDLMTQGIHPSIISKGYQMASKKAREILRKVAKKYDKIDRDILIKAAITTMNSKGVAGDRKLFANLAVDALMAIQSKDESNFKNVKNVMIVKKKGKSIHESEIVKGIILEKEPVHPLMARLVKNAKIAVMAQGFEIKKTEFSSDLQITRPEDIENFLEQEDRIIKRFADKLKEIGCNVIINQKGIEDDAAHYLNKYGIVAVKSVTKTDLEKLAKAVGANIVEKIETITEADLGYAETIEFKKIAGDDLCFISGCKNPKAVSILIRGGVNNNLAESERTIHDALCIVGKLMDEFEIVAGGGGIEMELCARLLEYAETIPGKERIAIEAFARALEIIPITLSENAGLDPIDMVAELRSKHEKPGNEWYGLELFSQKIANNFETGVIEPASNIDNILKIATELATMILRIDEMIRAKKADLGPSGGKPGGAGGMPGGPGGMGGMDDY